LGLQTSMLSIVRWLRELADAEPLNADAAKA
jgi:hypothetical protein